MIDNKSLNGYLTWAEIDLKAIARNVQAVKKRLDPTVGVMAVVKANAYGHGAVEVARAALAAGAEWLAVNRVEEGVALRQAGIEARTLVLGYCPPGQAGLVVEHNITPAVTTLDTAEALAERAQQLDREFVIHVKIDTGMGRLGLLPEEAVDFVGALAEFSGLKIEGVFSHLATADDPDPSFSRRQLQVYQDVTQALEAAGIEIPLHHLANSAAGLQLPETHHHLVRLGVAMYGLTPSIKLDLPVELRPAMTLKTRVARLRVLPAGAAVGYGRTFVAPEPTAVALAPVGYGDGYPRLCSNRGEMLVRGQRARVIGAVSMDQTSLDVSGIDDVSQDDEIVVFGRQGEAEISAEEVARWAETINYEIVTRLAARVPRIYLE
ncbi:MAG TPA: alanine racemase [Anaerolineae bacterium]|nr:alanine racemase [Anaerolineae bacterium]MCB9104254.1 alanine racemase [Anaerolineales bacterium]HRV93823.1 alanine racemase [Anaerolineae bacterium]